MKAPEHKIVQGHPSSLMWQSSVDLFALSFQEYPPPTPVTNLGVQSLLDPLAHGQVLSLFMLQLYLLW